MAHARRRRFALSHKFVYCLELSANSPHLRIMNKGVSRDMLVTTILAITVLYGSTISVFSGGDWPKIDQNIV